MPSLTATSSAAPRAPRRRHLLPCLGALLLLLLSLWGLRSWWLHLRPAAAPLVLAPMLSGLDDCLQNTPKAALPQGCQGPAGSAAHLVEATLTALAPAPAAANADWQLGYALKAPLLDFLRPVAGDWQVDSDAVRRLANTIQGQSRPVLLYLFSTHFASNAAIEAELAADPANLAIDPQGLAMPVDQYFGAKLYPWSIARTDNSLSQRRQQVIEAISTELCQRPQAVRERILGITLLGEVHQMFPQFESGMGFSGPGPAQTYQTYQVSDYSEASQQGFRQHLQQRFGTLAQLNAALGSRFADWQDITPPARDIRREPLAHYWQHMDSFAHGTLPISGWVGAGDTAGPPGVVAVYRNGGLLGRAPIRLGRQDVLAAKPALGTADVGWRIDLDFSQLPTGIHQLDLYLERAGAARQHLGRRQISVMDAQQKTPLPQPVQALPQATPASASLDYAIDAPLEASSYYFNPLAAQWHAYRQHQVVAYLQHFAKIVRTSCLADRPLYTHQLFPFSNPSWDANKYAVDASLQPLPGLRLGVSLYGEAGYGQSFADWLQGTPHPGYGVTEFHPLKALDATALAATLDRHRRRGAHFVSMFMEGRADGAPLTKQLNYLAFDPDNRRFGSDTLYKSLATVLASPPL